jgi:opacity protein-like surface antigen
MNKSKMTLAVAAAVSLLMAGATHAQSTNTSPWYMSADAGPALTQHIDIKQSPFGFDGNIRVNTGARAGLSLGYQCTPCLAAELSADMVENDVRAIHGNSLNTGESSRFWQVPVLASLVYKPLHGAFQPYIGAGAGVEASIFDVSNISPSSKVALLSPSFDGNDWVFAYEAKAGFNYNFTSHLSAGIGYKFLGSMEHDWQSNGNAIKTEGIFTHSVVASLVWQF